MNKDKFKHLLATVGLFGLTLPAAADTLPCIIEPAASVEVGTEVIGVLQKILVERGDQVRAGQIIARLNANVERQTVDLAALRVGDFSEIQSASAANKHASREKDRANQLFERELISKQALDKAVTEATLANHRLEQAQETQSQSKQELKLANAKLNQRYIRSPITGTVAERYLSPGQRIQNEAVVKVVTTHPLLVDVIVPAEHFNTFEKGQVFDVTPQLPGFGAHEATVKIIDRMIDAASNTFRITLELPNKDQSIPPGARCQANLGISTDFNLDSDF